MARFAQYAKEAKARQRITECLAVVAIQSSPQPQQYGDNGEMAVCEILDQKLGKCPNCWSASWHFNVDFPLDRFPDTDLWIVEITCSECHWGHRSVVSMLAEQDDDGFPELPRFYEGQEVYLIAPGVGVETNGEFEAAYKAGDLRKQYIIGLEGGESSPWGSKPWSCGVSVLRDSDYDGEDVEWVPEDRLMWYIPVHDPAQSKLQLIVTGE